MPSELLLAPGHAADEEGQYLPVRARATTGVLHLINGQHYAGAERVQDLLALRLGEFGFEAAFALLKPGQFSRLRRATGAPLYETPMRSRIDLRPAMALARVIRRDGYALVHTHTPRAALVGRLAAQMAGVPHVHHVHSPTARDSTRRWLNRASAAIERRSVSRAAALIAVSTAMGRYAETLGVQRDRIFVVPNGVAPREPLAERSTPTSDWRLGTVALFRPRKGLEVLLEAMSSLRAAGTRVRLIAVGAFETAAYEAEIRDLAGRLGLADDITWRGFQQDVYRELTEMDVFVLPSLFGEGLPMVILEAMTAGVPVVATAVEGVPEVIRDGLDGLIAMPADHLDLARQLSRIFAGSVDWSRLRTSAHRRQAEEFSDRKMAEGVAKVYGKVLA